MGRMMLISDTERRNAKKIKPNSTVSKWRLIFSTDVPSILWLSNTNFLEIISLNVSLKVRAPIPARITSTARSHSKVKYPIQARINRSTEKRKNQKVISAGMRIRPSISFHFGTIA
jgi:hypothetical protein